MRLVFPSAFATKKTITNKNETYQLTDEPDYLTKKKNKIYDKYAKRKKSFIIFTSSKYFI